jgi:exosortase A-associated hydrolase 1
LVDEIPVSFSCEGEWLYGLLHLPKQATQQGVIIVVGGPQYRVGSHRQFVLLARQLSQAGIPVLRFDYRGMGDSDSEVGTPEPCEHVGPDIHCAVDCFFENVPKLKEVVLLGLCDGASAAMLYGYADSRVSGLVLLNPWVSTETGAAKAYVKDYYLKRLVNSDFWKKVIKIELNAKESIISFTKILTKALKPMNRTSTNDLNAGFSEIGEGSRSAPLNDRIAESFKNFKGRVLIVLSGNDLISSEFKAMVKTSNKWKTMLKSPRVTCYDIPEADHTFSSRVWHDRVAERIIQWLE